MVSWIAKINEVYFCNNTPAADYCTPNIFSGEFVKRENFCWHEAENMLKSWLKI